MSNGIARGLAASLLGLARGGQIAGSIDTDRAPLQRNHVEGSSTGAPAGVWPEGTKREHGRRRSAGAVAAPATVSGELPAKNGHWATGKVGMEARTREPGDLPSAVTGLMHERGCSSVVG